MGTGSHRPQWEAAKGRPDELGGIRHARALRSHTRLKFRDTSGRALRKEIAYRPHADRSDKAENSALKSRPAREGEPRELKTSGKAQKNSTETSDEAKVGSTTDGTGNHDVQSWDTSGESSDDDSESEELRRELETLTKRNALRAQKNKSQEAPTATSKWRSEAAFSRKRRDNHGDNKFLDKYIR